MAKEPDTATVNHIQDLRTAKAEGQITAEQEAELDRLEKEFGDNRKITKDDLNAQSPNNGNVSVAG